MSKRIYENMVKCRITSFGLIEEMNSDLRFEVLSGACPNSINTESNIANFRLTASAKFIIDVLEGSGYLTLVVGGWIRDNMLGKNAKDVDIVTTATSSEIVALFPDARIIASRFPHVLIKIDFEYFEVSTFYTRNLNIDSLANSAHTPTNESRISRFWEILLDDCLSRDFTINCLYYSPSRNLVYDCLTSLRDLKERRVILAAPIDQYLNNALVVLRAVRIAERLDFEIDKSASAHFPKIAGNFTDNDVGRLINEIFKLFNQADVFSVITKIIKLRIEKLLFHDILNVEKLFTDPFVMSSLISLNESRLSGAVFSIEFILAVILWPKFNHFFGYNANLSPSSSDVIIRELRRSLFRSEIMNMASEKIFSIWRLQNSMALTSPTSSHMTVDKKYFTSAINFLSLRESCHEVPAGLAQSWLRLKLN